MATPVRSSGANNHSRLVGQIDYQSGAKAQLVESSRWQSEREIPESIIESGCDAEGLVKNLGHNFVLDLRQSPIHSQTASYRGQLRQSISEEEINKSENRKRGRTPEVDRQSVETSQESEPVRPAKRRRTLKELEELHSNTPPSPIQPTTRRSRKLLIHTSAKNSKLKEWDSPQDQCEIEDSYEQIQAILTKSFARIVVEIPVYEDFDRDAYAKISPSSAQSSSVSILESPYHNLTTKKNQFPSLPSEIIIPDSQEHLGDCSTESSRRVTSGGSVVSQTANCIPDRSKVEDERPTLETSIPFQDYLATFLANSVTSARQNTDSVSTESWQGAQIEPQLELFASPIPSVGLDFEVFQDRLVNPESASQQELSQGSSKDSALSQRDVNSQRSDLQRLRTKSTASASQNEIHHDKTFVTKIATTRRTPQLCVKEGSFQSYGRSLSPSGNQSHYLGGSGSNLPPRPHTPSDCKMAESTPTSASSQTSFAELAKQARNKVIARLDMPAGPAKNEVLASSPEQNMPHQMLPMRENISGIPGAPAEEIQDDDEQSNELTNITLSLLPMKATDHVILLPLESSVRKVYECFIQKRRREVTAFLYDDEVDPRVLEQIDLMVEELKMVADHQDLGPGWSSTQFSLPDYQQAKWAEWSSAKCLFLRSFLDALREEEKHVAILARPGRMLDILESILKFHNFIYERPDQAIRSDNSAIGPLRVTLLPTGLTGGQYVVNRADAVIAFDETFRVAECYSKALRAHLYEPRILSPLISLVIGHSAEHIELCLPKFDDPVERKRCLVNFIVRKSEKLGDLAEGLLDPERAASAAAEYIRFNGSTWPLPENPDITGLEVLESSHLQQIQSGMDALSQGQDSLPQMTPLGPVKRTLRADSGTDIDSTKRMRMTPTRGDIASSGDVTRISDTVGYRTQVQPASIADGAYEAIAKVDALDEEHTKYISSLLEKVDILEVELQNKQSTEEELRSLVRSLETRLDDYVSTLKKLEPKLVQSIADRRKFQTQRDAASSVATTLTQTVEARTIEIAKLKEDKVNLERELAIARNALSSSIVPETAQLAQTYEKLRVLQADKERLEKRIVSMQKDFEFTRDAYQKASSYTTELRNELTELQEEKISLQRKASENIIRIAEIQRNDEAKDREERIDELEALLRDRDQELRKKTEELRFKTNGRRETRGTSVPRSPRMGSGAMSPRPRFAQQAGGSRGGSPAPGDARDGFRDATLFPSSALASARWGHLNDR